MNSGMKLAIILASTSPRRKQLLSGLNLEFITHPPADDNEEVPAGTLPHDIVEMLSLRKARSVQPFYNTGLVIGSDTIVVLHGEVLGKPQTDDEAIAMLSKLQGNVHTVFSGIAVIDASSGKYTVQHNQTQVTIKPLSSELIRRYVATGEPRDKAGAYAIQGLGALLVEKMNGDYFTVVGLPLGLLSDMLQDFGVTLI